ncbi:MAG: radical SAM family heme chaperone HemW [Nitrosomonadales bacterium]|jgi:oxygen-independent coproporphyrinogen-3 oxidase|nr:radical SAM family heme chaperone HemW [Nitrosomonadales bacterium]MBT6015441.1 radical SAM family heme chaperone HemW [Nitrosomonadales bacterium]MBT6251038.1 radical SAM family heme chaperone HemW [Nitrosomonadales bacterium]MBT7407187.1 radical SAM family heme chaperone HemW [Nitrosomonadales bacterium]
MKFAPLSIYIHIPWCIHKCPYCDFNSHEFKDQHIKNNEEVYTSALIKQIENFNIDSKRSIHSIFFGGGTPSLFSPKAFDRLIQKLDKNFGLNKNCEITIEANPGTFDKQHFYGYKDVGINRMSLGVQSFNHEHLKKLERIHNPKEAFDAANLAVKIFDKVNIDLMFALPSQSLTDVKYDIAKALDVGVSHISYYHLTIEPNTLFNKFPPKLPDEEKSAEIYELIRHELNKARFDHYETSAYAKKNARCLHNLNYWNFGDYLGIGAGAHSKLSYEKKVYRQSCFKNPRDYINHINNNNFYDDEKILSTNDLIFEFMINALRLNDGFDTTLFETRTNIPISHIKKELNIAKDKKLITEKNGRIKPTILGQDFLNELLQIFLRD